MKLAIAGTGYVGLSLATLLSERHQVVALDIVQEKVDMINRRVSPIEDEYIDKYFKEKHLHLSATTDYKAAFSGADFVVVSTPTNYDSEQNFFDTSSVEDILSKVYHLFIDECKQGIDSQNNISDQSSVAPTVVIKSTIPVGFTRQMKQKYPGLNIVFSPEFLREGRALYDNLHPSRIIVGAGDGVSELKDGNTENESEKIAALTFAGILEEASLDDNTPVLCMGSTEAEAVKLFANTYLALRVSFFNELDTYADAKNLSTSDIIKGVSLDPRIGDYYNNPSFGYGGYCLPKDTKQLLANYKNVPQNLIEAIVKANDTRKQFIVDEICKMTKPTGKNVAGAVIGVYRLTMKSGSDNYRSSAIQDIIKKLKSRGKRVVIFEPTLLSPEFDGCEVLTDIDEFKGISSVILANRLEKDIEDVAEKVYTRDLFSRD